VVGEADCFVIDYKMPAMTGIDLANRLRNRHFDTPIILITGYPDENIEEKAAAAGIRHVLLKPHLEESLVSRIRRATKVRLPGHNDSGRPPVNYVGYSP
jgi:CheY-like chemotaxis protein